MLLFLLAKKIILNKEIFVHKINKKYFEIKKLKKNPLFFNFFLILYIFLLILVLLNKLF